MPKWAKVLLIVVGVGVLLVGIAGYIGAKALQGGIDHMVKVAEDAKVDGEVFGMTATQEECLEETANRSDCDRMQVICIHAASRFMWACLESATHDPSFCEGVPPSSMGQGIMNWVEKKCEQYGQPHEENCIMAISMTPGFCDSMRER